MTFVNYGINSYFYKLSSKKNNRKLNAQTETYVLHCILWIPLLYFSSCFSSLASSSDLSTAC